MASNHNNNLLCLANSFYGQLFGGIHSNEESNTILISPSLFLSPSLRSQRHYNEEDPEKEKRVKEIELLLMSTENELRGQPSQPVSVYGCVCVSVAGLQYYDSEGVCVCVRVFVCVYAQGGNIWGGLFHCLQHK